MLLAVAASVWVHLTLFNVVVCAVVAAGSVVGAVWWTLPPRRPLDATDYAFSDASGAMHPFPSLLTTGASVELSLIVPMYNEEARLDVMMEETMQYLEARAAANPGFTYEVLLVDDGSSDRSIDVAMAYVRAHGSDRVRICPLPANRGKGGAVRQGMLLARGQRLLMVDADGATQFADLERLEEALARTVTPTGLGIAVGSRAHLEDAAVAERSMFRNLLMWGFHFLVSSLCVSGIRDTQCGFKLFTREAAQTVFPPLHLERWAFDVEMLYIAQRMAVPVVEVAVNWEEIDGSHLNPLTASLQMFRDLIRIRLCYVLGFWSENDV